MKGSFVKILSFSLITGAIYLLLLLLISSIDAPKPRINVGKIESGSRGHTLQRFREISEYKNVDILFIGSSTCYRSFDPRIFRKNGYAVFNMGSTNQTPLNTYFLLQQYIDSLSPKRIVFDVAVGTLNNSDGLEGFCDLAVNLPFSFNLLKMGVATGNVYALNSLLQEFAFKRVMCPYEEKEQQLIPGENYIEGGYVETNLLQRDKLDGIEDFSLTLSSDQKKYFEQILNLAAEKGVKIDLVIQPIPVIDRIVNYNEVKSWVANIAKANNARLTDFNDELQLDPNLHFFDAYHLNSAGVELYNDKVLEVLFEKGERNE